MEDFMKRNSIVEMNSKSFNALANDTKNIASLKAARYLFISTDWKTIHPNSSSTNSV